MESMIRAIKIGRVTLRLDDETKLRLDLAVVRDRTNIQRVLEGYVREYIEASEARHGIEQRVTEGTARAIARPLVPTSERPLYSISKAEQGSKKRDRVEEEDGVGYEGE
jgi:predicted transcriptional regulator